MHSAALLRNWSKLGKSASIIIHMGNECAVGSAALKISFERSRQVEVGHKALSPLGVLHVAPLARDRVGALTALEYSPKVLQAERSVLTTA